MSAILYKTQERDKIWTSIVAISIGLFTLFILGIGIYQPPTLLFAIPVAFIFLFLAEQKGNIKNIIIYEDKIVVQKRFFNNVTIFIDTIEEIKVSIGRGTVNAFNLKIKIKDKSSYKTLLDLPKKDIKNIYNIIAEIIGQENKLREIM